MRKELSRLWRRLRSLQYQPELGAGVTDCQVVENPAQRGEDVIVSWCGHAVHAYDEGSLLVVGEQICG